MSSMTPGDLAAGRPSILLVDDHEDARVALARLLSVVGYAVTDVENGAAAFAALANAPPPDFLLTDLRLPDHDGREIIEAARQLKPAPRIALMTGWDVEPDERERLGIEWVFTKPIDFGQLVESLRGASPPAA